MQGEESNRSTNHGESWVRVLRAMYMIQNLKRGGNCFIAESSQLFGWRQQINLLRGLGHEALFLRIRTRASWARQQPRCHSRCVEE